MFLGSTNRRRSLRYLLCTTDPFIFLFPSVLNDFYVLSAVLHKRLRNYSVHGLRRSPGEGKKQHQYTPAKIHQSTCDPESWSLRFIQIDLMQPRFEPPSHPSFPLRLPVPFFSFLTLCHHPNDTTILDK